jgi:hypothetical protein
VTQPFIVSEHGDIDFFDSLETIEDYLEPIDVKNNEFEFFDATGEKLIGEVVKAEPKPKTIFSLVVGNAYQREKVIVKPSGIDDIEGLKKILLDYGKWIRIDIDANYDLRQIIDILIKSGKVDYYRSKKEITPEFRKYWNKKHQDKKI